MNFEKRDKVERYKRLNQFVKKGQILFAGSSLMEQFPIYEFLQDFDLPYHIYNRGIGGFTTVEMLEVMEECVYSLEPAHIFLNIGTNDINMENYTLEQLISRYETILKNIMLHLPDTKIYLLAYYPVNEPIGLSYPELRETFEQRTNQRINEANEAVKSLAEHYGIEFYDLNRGIKDKNGNLKAEYTIEGMHMYANGYRKVLEELIPILNEISKNA